MAKKKQVISNNSTETEVVDVNTTQPIESVESAAPVAQDSAVSESVTANVMCDTASSSVQEQIGGDAAVAVAKPQKSEESIADKVRIVSPIKLVFKRFFRSKLSVIGLVLFLAVVVFSFLGPAFVPWGQSEIDRSGSERTYYEFELYTEVDSDGNALFSYYTVGVTKPDINAHAHAFTFGYNNEGKKALHLLGTDSVGYDILVRLMYGGRLSLMLSFLVVIVYTIIGVILGGLAGYFGGWVDMVIMRLVDILNCLPSLPILLIVGAFFDNSGMSENYRVYFMMGVLTLMSWPGTTRLVRGQILFLREQEYMIATDALGFSPARKIFKHLVPNVMPQLIVSMTLGLGGTILTEASLSFLNLGAPPTIASLGRMVNAAKDPSVLTNYVADWLPAGFIIILAVVAFNFIGDGLRDALDPKMKR